jgi:hypothetical protein
MNISYDAFAIKETSEHTSEHIRKTFKITEILQ